MKKILDVIIVCIDYWIHKKVVIQLCMKIVYIFGFSVKMIHILTFRLLLCYFAIFSLKVAILYA